MSFCLEKGFVSLTFVFLSLFLTWDFVGGGGVVYVILSRDQSITQTRDCPVPGKSFVLFIFLFLFLFNF